MPQRGHGSPVFICTLKKSRGLRWMFSPISRADNFDGLAQGALDGVIEAVDFLGQSAVRLRYGCRRGLHKISSAYAFPIPAKNSPREYPLDFAAIRAQTFAKLFARGVKRFGTHLGKIGDALDIVGEISCPILLSS